MRKSLTAGKTWLRHLYCRNSDLNFEQGQFWTKNWTSEFAREMAKPKVMKSLNEARPLGAKRSFKSRFIMAQKYEIRENGGNRRICIGFCKMHACICREPILIRLRIFDWLLWIVKVEIHA
jgi:hypothetical protein